eukprot:scaffold41637_cov59-Phaeocystis_antarctica.AAC.1
MKGSGVPWVGMSEQSPKKRENSQPSSLSGVACIITTGKPLKRAQRTSSANFLPVWGGGREVSSEQQGKEFRVYSSLTRQTDQDSPISRFSAREGERGWGRG